MNCGKVKTNSIDYTVPYIVPVLLLAVDYLAIISAEITAIYLRQKVGFLSVYHTMPNIPHLYIYFLVPIVFIAFLYNSNMYVSRMPFWEIIQKIFHAVIVSMMVSITMMYFGHIAGGVSRIYVALFGMTAFFFLCSYRYFLKKILFNMHLLLEPIIVIGAGKTAELICGKLAMMLGLV